MSTLLLIFGTYLTLVYIYFWDISNFGMIYLTLRYILNSLHWWLKALVGPWNCNNCSLLPPTLEFKSNFQIPNKSKLVSNTKASHRPEQLSESTGKRVLLRRLVGPEKSVPGILKRIHLTGGCELRSLFRMKPKVRQKN